MKKINLLNNEESFKLSMICEKAYQHLLREVDKRDVIISKILNSRGIKNVAFVIKPVFIKNRYVDGVNNLDIIFKYYAMVKGGPLCHSKNDVLMFCSKDVEMTRDGHFDNNGMMKIGENEYSYQDIITIKISGPMILDYEINCNTYCPIDNTPPVYPSIGLYELMEIIIKEGGVL